MSKHNGTAPAPAEEPVVLIPMNRVIPCPTNPRKTFDPEKLQELATTIAAGGVLVPTLMRPAPNRAGWYELVDGERRFRASKLAKQTAIRAIVRPMTDAQVAEYQLVIDMQRENINDLERAEGLQRQIAEHGAKVEDLAKKFGYSPSTLRDLVRLRDVPPILRQPFVDGVVVRSTALAIARVPGARARDLLARMVLTGVTAWFSKEPPSDAYVANSLKNPHPLTYDATRKLIDDSFCRQLKSAPFDTKSLALLPSAGSCDSCTKKAGNMDDPEFKKSRADMCMDPQCYQQKVLARAAQIAAEYRANGVRVMQSNESAKLFSDFEPGKLREDAGYIDLDVNCPQDQKNRTYEKLLAEPLAGEIAVAIDPDGIVHRLVPEAAAKAELKRQGVTSRPTPSEPPPEQAAHQKKVSETKAAARIANGYVAREVEAAAGGVVGVTIRMEELLRSMLQQLADDVGKEACRQVMLRRDLPPTADINTLARGLYPRALFGLFAELIAALKSGNWGPDYRPDKDELAWWKDFGVDPKKCHAAAKAAEPTARFRVGDRVRRALLNGVHHCCGRITCISDRGGNNSKTHCVQWDAPAGRKKASPRSEWCDPAELQPASQPIADDSVADDSDASWRNVTVTDLGLKPSHLTYWRRKQLFDAGSIADWIERDRARPLAGRDLKLANAARAAIEILKSNARDQPSAMERVLNRQHEDDFDLADKEAACG